MRSVYWMIVCGLCLLMGAAGCASSRAGDQARATDNPIKAEFDASADKAPTPRTLYAMSRILVARGEHEKARYVLSRIIEQDPSFVPAYNELAESYMHEDRTGEAIQTLYAALDVAPDDAIVHNNLGLALLIRGDHAGAFDHFDRAVTLHEANARYRANRAAALALGGSYDAALADYLAVMAADEAHHNLAVIAEARGDHERAASESALAASSKRRK